VEGQHPSADITLARIRPFVALAETLSYRGAAEILHITEPNLSRQIAALEKALGFLLIERTRGSRSVRVTARGQRLLALARQMRDAAEGLRQIALELRESGEAILRLACYPAHVDQVVARALKSFAENHPSTAVSIQDIDDQLRRNSGLLPLERLTERAVDIVIAPGPGSTVREGIDSNELYSWHLVAVGSTEHLREVDGTSITIAQLAKLPLLMSPARHLSRDLLTVEAGQETASLTVKYESESVEVLLALAREGLGIAVLPNDALGGRSIKWARTMTVVGTVTREIGSRYFVYWRRADEQPALLDLLSAIHAAVGERQTEGQD
jgi:DNA-binding transcriptional LysR family regulator